MTVSAFHRVALVAGIVLLGVIGIAPPAYGDAPAYFQFITQTGEKPSIVEITDPATIADARRLIAQHKTKILTGLIVTKPAPYNPLYHFYFVPSSVRLADMTTEVCDATATYVGEHLHDVGGHFLPGNRWCPWKTLLIHEVWQQ